MTISTASEEKIKDSLPFAIEERSFSIWLNSLYTRDKTETLQLLLHTLKSLKQIALEANIRAFFLEQILGLVLQFSGQLQKTYAKSYFPFSDINHLKVELSANCAMETAHNYALVCKDEYFKSLFSPQQKTLIIYNAIQSMANVLLYKAVLYKKPDKGFWALCFLFYLLAKKNEVLESTLNQQAACFIKVFKQLLVFELCNSQQFNTEEIFVIFNFLGNLSEYIDILPAVYGKQLKTIPCFNLRIDAPPAKANEPVSKGSSCQFYISSQNLIKQLFDLFAHKKSMTYSHKIIILRLIKTLTMNQRRKTERKLADNELFAEIGFSKFNEFLLRKKNILENSKANFLEVQELSLDEQLKKQTRGETYGFKNEQQASLSLTSLPEENVIEYVDSADIWSSNSTKPELSAEEIGTNVALIDQSNLGFCVRLKEKNVAIKVGEIIHLIFQPSSVLTVVRRIISPQNNNVVVGVEVLGYDAELFQILDNENKATKIACILTNIEGVESIVIKANEYQGEEFLYIEKGEESIRYRVEKTLNSSTSTFKLLKVVLS